MKESLDERIDKMLSRLGLVKDSDPFNKRLMNDAYNLIKDIKETHYDYSNKENYGEQIFHTNLGC